MPNWASFNYKIVAETENDLQVLKDAFEKMEEKNLVQNGFGNLWLGNLVTALGGDCEKVRCRGEITYYDFSGNILSMSAEWAWWQDDGFVEFLYSKLPEGVNILWQGEEPGMCLYYTNDDTGSYFSSRYYVDACIDGEFYSEYFSDECKMYEYVESLMKIIYPDTKLIYNDISELESLCQELVEDTDDFLYIHECKYSES